MKVKRLLFVEGVEGDLKCLGLEDFPKVEVEVRKGERKEREGAREEVEIKTDEARY